MIGPGAQVGDKKETSDKVIEVQGSSLPVFKKGQNSIVIRHDGEHTAETQGTYFSVGLYVFYIKAFVQFI